MMSVAMFFPSAYRAGFHDNVPDRPSAKVSPVGCQLETMALKIKTVTIPKGGLHGRSCDLIGDVSASGLSCTRLADFLPPWAVNRLGRCRATWPWMPCLNSHFSCIFMWSRFLKMNVSVSLNEANLSSRQIVRRKCQ